MQVDLSKLFSIDNLEYVVLNKSEIPKNLMFSNNYEFSYSRLKDSEILYSILLTTPDLQKLIDYKLCQKTRGVYVRNEYSTSPNLINNLKLLFDLLSIATIDLLKINSEKELTDKQVASLKSEIKDITNQTKYKIKKQCKLFENKASEIVAEIMKNNQSVKEN